MLLYHGICSWEIWSKDIIIVRKAKNETTIHDRRISKCL